MKFTIYHHDEPPQNWITVNGPYKSFSLWPDTEEYDEETSRLMQKTAGKLFQYPFYIHFEGYDDERDDVLSLADSYIISHQNTGRTVLTMNGFKIYRAPVPCFTVQITDQRVLKNVFSEWFHLACQNMMWLITQHKELSYKEGFAAVTSSSEPLILIADHDAQGFTLMNTLPSLQTKEDIIILLNNT